MYERTWYVEGSGVTVLKLQWADGPLRLGKAE